jgi:hypothetical protein
MWDAADPEPLPGNYAWTPHERVPRSFVAFAGFLVVLMAVMEVSLAWIGGPVALERGFAFQRHHGTYNAVVVVWLMMIGFPVTGLCAFLAIWERRVGVGDRGVRVVAWLGHCDVPWNAVAFLVGSRRHPSPRSGDWATLYFPRAGRARALLGPRSFYVSRAQVRAMIAHPASAAYPLPPEIVAWANARD